MMESAQIQRQKSSQIQEMRALNCRCRTRQVAYIIALRRGILQAWHAVVALK